MRNFMIYFVCLLIEYMQRIWCHLSNQGFKVCRYLFVRCDNEPAPWTRYALFYSVAHLTLKRPSCHSIDKFLNWKRSDDRGDRPRALPVIRELKKATFTFERTESPSWDFDVSDYWGVHFTFSNCCFFIFFNNLYKTYFLKYKLEFLNIFNLTSWWLV